MKKDEFLIKLCSQLGGMPMDEIEKSVSYYSEMIDDRIEAGEREEEAVASLGSVKEIATQILSQMSLTSLVATRLKPKRSLKAWEIILIILGSPIWFSLIIAAVSVIFSVYVTLWSLVVSLYAVMVSFLASGVGGIGLLFVYIVTSNLAQGFMFLGMGLVVLGLGILLIKPTVLATKGMWSLSGAILNFIKRCIIGGGKEK